VLVRWKWRKASLWMEPAQAWIPAVLERGPTWRWYWEHSGVTRAKARSSTCCVRKPMSSAAVRYVRDSPASWREGYSNLLSRNNSRQDSPADAKGPVLIPGAGRIVGADQNTVWILGADHTVHEFSKRSRWPRINSVVSLCRHLYRPIQRGSHF